MIGPTTLSERACPPYGTVFRHPLATQVLSARIVELAQIRRRFGYHGLHDLLRPEFPNVNHRKVYRLYRETNLAMRRLKKPSGRPSERQALLPANRSNTV